MLHSLLCVGFWAVIALALCYQAIFLLPKAIQKLQKLHQIPCSNCAYFTGEYHLKCPLNPMAALSEDAIACKDFQHSCSCHFSNWQHRKESSLTSTQMP